MKKDQGGVNQITMYIKLYILILASGLIRRTEVFISKEQRDLYKSKVSHQSVIEKEITFDSILSAAEWMTDNQLEFINTIYKS